MEAGVVGTWLSCGTEYVLVTFDKLTGSLNCMVRCQRCDSISCLGNVFRIIALFSVAPRSLLFCFSVGFIRAANVSGTCCWVWAATRYFWDGVRIPVVSC